MLACPRCGSAYLRDVVHCGLDGERLVQAPQDMLVGRTIDRYAIEGVLGDGGMARVYRARHIHLAQPFALKVLFGDMATDRALAERFRREGQSAAQIKHPNVVSVTDFGVSAEGLSFMAMELLDGPTLSEVARRDRPLAPPQLAAIARQVAEGLGAAHALGFVHRDLKPKNVMVVKEGTSQRVKILDFGLVRPLDSDDARLTQQGQIFGTPAYMAPEQITEGEIDARTDLYALGAMIYELLSGKPPFVGTMAEIFRKHLYEAPAPLPDRSGLGELALVLLSKERAARPRNTREVIEIIDGLGLGLGTEGHLVSMPPALAGRPQSSKPELMPPEPGRPMPSKPGSLKPVPSKSAPSQAGAPLRGPGASSDRPHLDVTGASPAASADMSLDGTDSLGIAIGDSREIDDRAIEKMAAGARPSLLMPLIFAVAAAVAGWLGYRSFIAEPPPPHVSIEDAAPRAEVADAGAAGASAAEASDARVSDAGERAGAPRPRTSIERAAGAAAASAAGGLTAGLGGIAQAAAAGVAGAAGGDLDDLLPPIPSRDAGIDAVPEPTLDPDAAGASAPDAGAPSDARATSEPPPPDPPASASPTPTPSPTPSVSRPAAEGGFAAADRELRRALIERDLHLLDLESNAPEAVRRWRSWRVSAERQEPNAAARDEAFASLREAAGLLALDTATLLELKIARLDRRVRDLAAPAVQAELDELVRAAAAATSARARAASLSQLLAFELKVDRLRGED